MGGVKMRLILVIAGVAAVFFLLFSGPRVKSSLAQWVISLPARRTARLVTPWEAVGGCGSSSGSVASGMQLKWIGRGVTGALIDFEAVAGQSQDFDTSGIGSISGDGIVTGLTTNALLLNVFYHPPNIDFKVTAPLIIKHGYYQNNGYATNLLGDLTHTIRPDLVAGVPLINPLWNRTCPVGSGCQPYLNPAAFFAKSYPTRGMKELLKAVCLRLSGRGGEVSSIIRLGTQYGGGKTHSLIALVHAVRGM